MHRISDLCDDAAYLVTGEHLLHHAFMFRRVVAVVSGREGPVWTEAHRKNTSYETCEAHDVNPARQEIHNL